MWNDLLFCLEATSLWSFSLWPECVEEKLDARLTVKAPSAQKTSYFPFWKIKLHEGSCISNLFSVESRYDQLSMQSASLLSFFLGIAFGKKKWLCISIPLLRLIIELNMTALNGFGLNMSPWGVPLVTGLCPAVHCCPLSLKIQPGFCLLCSLVYISPHWLRGRCLKPYWKFFKWDIHCTEKGVLQQLRSKRGTGL